jgi:hypothetical protein
VNLHGTKGDVELTSDLLVGLTLGHAAEDITLATSEGFGHED